MKIISNRIVDIAHMYYPFPKQYIHKNIKISNGLIESKYTDTDTTNNKDIKIDWEIIDYEILPKSSTLFFLKLIVN